MLGVIPPPLGPAATTSGGILLNQGYHQEAGSVASASGVQNIMTEQ